jgi:hypothetical protein
MPLVLPTAVTAPGAVGPVESAVTVALEVAIAPEFVPSDGVTWTLRPSPVSPFPATARS